MIAVPCWAVRNGCSSCGSSRRLWAWHATHCPEGSLEADTTGLCFWAFVLSRGRWIHTKAGMASLHDDACSQNMTLLLGSPFCVLQPWNLLNPRQLHCQGHFTGNTFASWYLAHFSPHARIFSIYFSEARDLSFFSGGHFNRNIQYGT